MSSTPPPPPLADIFKAAYESMVLRHELSMAATGIFSKGKFFGPRLKLHDEIRAHIEREYLARKGEAWKGEAPKFVRRVEIAAEGMASMVRLDVPEQDVRRDQLNQLQLALERLHETVTKLDSQALSYVVTQLEEALSDGESKEAADPQIAYIFAGLLRDFLDEGLRTASDSVRKAVKTLPVPDRKAFDWRLRGALNINRLFFDERFEFEVKETSFAADCFRWACELANPKKEMDRPKYWLQKALDHPEAMKNLLGGPDKKAP